MSRIDGEVRALKTRLAALEELKSACRDVQRLVRRPDGASLQNRALEYEVAHLLERLEAGEPGALNEASIRGARLARRVARALKAYELQRGANVLAAKAAASQPAKGRR